MVYGEGQEDCQPLPALKLPDGQVITCWEFAEEEEIQDIVKKYMYINQLTFNGHLQPILPVVNLEDGLNLEL